MVKKNREPEAKPRGRGRLPRGYPVHSFQVRLPVALHEQLLAAMRKSRRSQNAEVQVAIEKHLEAMGLWTPDPES